MKLHLKALLLSALVLPGLGQLYKGDRIKGIILILLVNLFLLLALFLALKGLGPGFFAAKITGKAPDAAQVLELLRSNAGAGRRLLASFFGLWLYAAADAAFRPVSRNHDK